MSFLTKLFKKPNENDSIAEYRKPSVDDASQDMARAQALYDEATEHYQAGDYEEAATLLLESASLGLADAQRSLGVMHCQGLGVRQDYEKGHELLKKSAEQGNIKACHNLGVMYYHGFGVKQSHEEAFAWPLPVSGAAS